MSINGFMIRNRKWQFQFIEECKYSPHEFMPTSVLLSYTGINFFGGIVKCTNLDTHIENNVGISIVESAIIFFGPVHHLEFL